MIAAPGGVSSAPNAFGFQVPTGSPAAIDAAASACSSWAAALSGRAAAVRSGAATAQQGWSGQAESGFAAFASHVESVYDALGGTVASAGKVLSTFAQELDTAQRVTSRALQDCESLSTQLGSAQAEAAGHAQTVQSLSSQLATAVHPAQQAALTQQLTAAQNQQSAAENAARQAQGQLQSASQQGQRAWQLYEQQAQAASRALQGLTEQIVKVEGLPAGAGGAGVAGSEFFWPTLGGVIGAWQTDSVLETAEGLLARYRKTSLVLPITESASQELEAIAPALGSEGPDFVWSAAGSLLVPRGSSADPLIPTLMEATSGSEWTTPGNGFLAPSESTLEGVAPGWSSGAAKVLGVGGVGLTLWGTGAEQWAYDGEHHPTWSTAARVADAAQTAAVVGGSEAVGGWEGAAAGAEGGAMAGGAIGEAIFPLGGGVVGGVVGGLVGGVGGGFAGSQVGKAFGHGVEDLGHDAVHLWNSIFG